MSEHALQSSSKHFCSPGVHLRLDSADCVLVAYVLVICRCYAMLSSVKIRGQTLETVLSNSAHIKCGNVVIISSSPFLILQLSPPGNQRAHFLFTISRRFTLTAVEIGNEISFLVETFARH